MDNNGEEKKKKGDFEEFRWYDWVGTIVLLAAMVVYPIWYYKCSDASVYIAVPNKVESFCLLEGQGGKYPIFVSMKRTDLGWERRPFEGHYPYTLNFSTRWRDVNRKCEMIEEYMANFEVEYLIDPEECGCLDD